MPSSKLTLKIDTELCIGAASCVSIAPQLFKLDEDNVAYLVDPVTSEEKTTLTLEVTEAEKALIEEAIDNCPTSAISVVF
jgi:ferredoxin